MRSSGRMARQCLIPLHSWCRSGGVAAWQEAAHFSPATRHSTAGASGHVTYYPNPSFWLDKRPCKLAEQEPASMWAHDTQAAEPHDPSSLIRSSRGHVVASVPMQMGQRGNLVSAYDQHLQQQHQHHNLGQHQSSHSVAALACAQPAAHCTNPTACPALRSPRAHRYQHLTRTSSWALPHEHIHSLAACRTSMVHTSRHKGSHAAVQGSPPANISQPGGHIPASTAAHAEAATGNISWPSATSPWSCIYSAGSVGSLSAIEQGHRAIHSSARPAAAAHSSLIPAEAGAEAATGSAASVPSQTTVHTSQLQNLVQRPTLETWATATQLVQQQVPSRLQHLQQQLRLVLVQLHSARGQQPPGQHTASGDTVQALARVVQDSCDRTQKACDQFLSGGLATAGSEQQQQQQQQQQQRSAALDFASNPDVSSSVAAGNQSSSAPAAPAAADAAPAPAAPAPAAAQPIQQSQSPRTTAVAEPVDQALSGGRALAVAQAADCMRQWVDAESQRVTSDLRQITEQQGWWEQPMHVISALDAIMDIHMGFTLSMRVLLGEVLCSWERLRRAHGLVGMGFDDEHGTGSREAARWSMAGPKGPPGWEEARAKRTPPSLIMPQAPLVQLLRLATEDTRAFCIEKNSMAPDVEVHGDEQLRVTCIDTYVQHIYGEVLKNSMQALIGKFGAWDVDEAESIQVTVEVVPGPVPGGSEAGSTKRHEGPSTIERDTSQHLQLTVTDKGGGLSPAQLERCTHWFTSSHAPRQDGYGYSRTHGAQFQGLGVGMPLSRIYARLMGGRIDWEVDREVGQTSVRLCLPCDGFLF